MIMRLATLVGLSLILAGPAAAAGFNCAKAQTPFAKAICTDPQISDDNRDLAAAYRKAITGLSGPAKQEVTSAQEAWLRFVRTLCTMDLKPATRPYDVDGLECLDVAFEDRAHQLRNAGEKGGLRIYYVDRYAAFRDPEPPDPPDSPDINNSIADKMVSTPRIDGTSPEAVAFNRYIETGTADYVDPSITSDPGPDAGTAADQQTLTITTVTPARITMAVDNFYYEIARSQGGDNLRYIHYLRRERRLLVAGDIFKGAGWQRRLQALVLAATKKKEGADLKLDDPSAINQLVVDPTRWDFSTKALIVYFNNDEVTVPDIGPVRVKIPWSDLKGLLAPGAAALYAS
jgi:uncharacterized protein